MLSKRARPYDPESLSKRARLRRNVEDIFASGLLSASRLTEVCSDINGIDPISFADVARVPQKSRRKDMSRWWKRRLKKKIKWMPHYWAQVRVLEERLRKKHWSGWHFISHMR